MRYVRSRAGVCVGETWLTNVPVIKPDALEQFFLSDASAALSKRCFWADSTLTALRRSIQTLINDYNVTFTDDVWEGKHETIWPLQEFSSHRSAIYGTRMSSLRAKFDRKVQRLEDLSREIEARQKEIVDQEARRSTIAANIAAHASTVTIQQGRNIRLLATVSVFFLPLTYVTSVFGMTNMPTEQNYWMFGAVTAAVCVPFFTLVISLNNERGFAF